MKVAKVACVVHEQLSILLPTVENCCEIRTCLARFLNSPEESQ